MLIIQRPAVEPIGEEEANRQRFAVGPLEPGFGHTLGNSLRRTLLSSIPGAAVTQVRFDDALHEFTTLPGVKEDVTDIILNLKDLVLRVDSDEPVTLRLDARGPATVTAGDLQATSEVEILDPDLVIATLNGKGRLAMDVTVERGRGYVSAERNKRSATIGVIPVDSIFSPVRRVAFSVEPTRVEQSTNYDRLVLDIETDGSISPREALASAGGTPPALLGPVAGMSEKPQGGGGGGGPQRGGPRLGSDAAHEKAMRGTLVASLIAAEAIVTTEAKAKALRPVVERVITKAKKGGVHRHRQVVAFIRDKDMAHKLFADVGPRYVDRPGGYTRILKLGPRHGDNAPMARIELV